MALKVAYEAGHGGFGVTPGKRTPDGEYEWDFNDVVARAFANEMKNYEGASLLRTDDATGKTDVPLTARTNKANNWGADVMISFHHNANTGKWGTWTGTEVHVYQTRPAESTKLANKVAPVLAKAYGLANRGVKATNLHITREAHMTAILIEGGFMDSTIDIKKLRDNAVLQKAGREVAKATAEFYGLKRKAKAPSTSTPKPKPKQNPRIRTGGLNEKNLAKVVAYLKDKGWYWTASASKGNNPRITTGGLNPAMQKEFGGWLDEQGMWWTLVK